MPVIRVETNVKIPEDAKKNMRQQLTETIENVIGKPKDFAVVQLIDGMDMIRAGTDNPAALCQVINLGTMEESHVKKVGDSIAGVLEKEISVPRKRLYVKFDIWKWEEFCVWTE
eukprot:gb/GECH01002636.1/.p1 GENE.gb/GECH01002636.1/~~gb/GECH01002636.1/.p1  ORF type:complete len:114 (+),score=35.90 gb/GECH01002636.1/:1-342(+)